MLYLTITAIILLIFCIIVYWKYKKSHSLNSLKEIAANERKNLNTISNVLDNMLIKIYDCIPSSENVHASMKEISTESKKLSESASLRYSNINLINNLIDKMYNDINQNFLTAKEVSASAISTSERVKEKKNSIENTISEFNKISSEINNAKNSLYNLDEWSQEINKMISSIRGIASQTNLLALNATIEAGRAGIHGKGFSVVAQEIRKLSNETSNVVNTITKIIENIRNEMANSTQIINFSIEGIRKQSDILNKTIFDIDTVAEIIQRFSSELAILSDSTQSIVENCRQIKALNYEMEESVKNDANAIDALNSSIIEITNEMVSINSIVNSLENLIEDIFRVLGKYTINIKEKNKLLVVSSPYPPFVIQNSNPDYLGIDIDIIKEIYKTQNIEIEVKIVPWNIALDQIKRGTADLIPAISYTDERAVYIDFSEPYREQIKSILFAKSGSNVEINSYEDLKKYKIGIIGSYNYSSNFINDPEIQKDASSNESIMFKKLLKGQIDALLINEYAGYYYIKNNNLGNKVRKMNFTFTEELTTDTRMGFSKTNNLSNMVDIFNTGYKKLLKSGIINNIEKKYLK